MHTTLKKFPPSLPLHTGCTLHCIVHRPSPPLVTVYWHAAGIVENPLSALVLLSTCHWLLSFCFLRLLRLLLSDFVCYPLWVLKNGALAALVLRLQYCDISLLDLGTHSSRSFRLGFQEMACLSSCLYSAFTVTVLCYISLDADSSRVRVTWLGICSSSSMLTATVLCSISLLDPSANSLHSCSCRLGNDSGSPPTYTFYYLLIAILTLTHMISL